MTSILFFEQLLNGVQFGTMLFLMSAGLTLIFGVMGLINLAHGSFYMIGAFSAALIAGLTGSFWFALLASNHPLDKKIRIGTAAPLASSLPER